MTDSVTVDPPSMPVLVGLYRDLDALLQRIAGASSADVDDVQVAELVRVNERVVRALTFQAFGGCRR
ncbi:hypothetical protein [Williamsia sp. DF01-3]|uniref:hypothetical protein n=1 Tax=Williamsia sp. DF01-3 TaxID=2934157 RepID=UPI001FF25BD8|nr:hypothetical protein [Williamsia sp. DF01-3]MCK0517504.1 hypothetical protein [Williamsia sp. DF01-3]